MFFRKLFLPWTAAAAFDREDAFLAFLQNKHRQFTNWRMIAILIAAIPLIVGYVLDLHHVMMITIAPLLVVLVLSIGLDQIEKQLPRPEEPED